MIVELKNIMVMEAKKMYFMIATWLAECITMLMKCGMRSRLVPS